MKTKNKRWENVTILSNGNKLTEFQDYAGKFRWRLQAKGNNEIIVSSSQGFSTKHKSAMNYIIVRRHFMTCDDHGRQVRPHRSGGGHRVG